MVNKPDEKHENCSPELRLKLFGFLFELLRAQIVNLNKKLDDREADLIEAKKEERERVIEWVEKHTVRSITDGLVFIDANDWQFFKEVGNGK